MQFESFLNHTATYWPSIIVQNNKYDPPPPQMLCVVGGGRCIGSS